MAKINVRIPIQCEKDVIVPIESPIRPCCLDMEKLLFEKNDAIKHDDERNYNSLRIDNNYWTPMRYCPYCGKSIKSADKKKRKSKKTYEEYDFIEYQPLKG